MTLISGSVLNAGTVIVGSLLGIYLGNFVPKRILSSLKMAIGLITMAISISLIIKIEDVLLCAGCIILGTLIGSLIEIEHKIQKLESRFKKSVDESHNSLSEGISMAFILFCIGPMTILGCLNEGLKGDLSIIATKAIMDGVAAIILSTNYRFGILLSAVPLFIFQFGLVIVSHFFGLSLSDGFINNFSAVGGVLLFGISFSLLDLKKIPVINMIPSLLLLMIAYFLGIGRPS